MKRLLRGEGLLLETNYQRERRQLAERRKAEFELFIMRHPELEHVRTRVRVPGQEGSRERGFGTMKYEWLFRDEVDNGLDLVDRIAAYRQDHNHVRPHEAIAWNRPAEVYADPTIPNSEIKETLPAT